jgi:NAD-dependent deacetylase
VIELHGNINRSKCSVTHRPISREWLVDQEGAPPPSPYVRHGLARPDVVWFGEVLPQEAIDRATAIAERSDFCFSIGTTSLVHPAAGLPLIAARNGARLVEINPVETALSVQADQCLRDTAAVALPAIRDQLRTALGS